MASIRLPTRTRGAQRTRVTGDENATIKHTRTGSGIGRLAGGIGKAGAQRPALGEVTTIAVNRKDIAGKIGGKEKDTAEAGLKRKSIGPQRVAVTTAPARTRTSVTRAPRQSLLPAKRNPTIVPQVASNLIIAVDEEYEEKQNSMEY